MKAKKITLADYTLLVMIVPIKNKPLPIKNLPPEKPRHAIEIRREGWEARAFTEIITAKCFDGAKPTPLEVIKDVIGLISFDHPTFADYCEDFGANPNSCEARDFYECVHRAADAFARMGIEWDECRELLDAINELKPKKETVPHA